MKPVNVFSIPVNQLPASVDFIETCLAMGYITLGDIVEMPVRQMIGNKDFTYGWLSELTSLLIRYGQLSALQSLPKSTIA